MNLLNIKDLSVTYSGIYALRSVSVTIEKRKVVSIVGPNGAGKTTLLRTISGLVKPEPNSKIIFKEKILLEYLLLELHVLVLLMFRRVDKFFLSCQ